jgi:[ribosomal protein S5]-alanine N-acetyltransferase
VSRAEPVGRARAGGPVLTTARLELRPFEPADAEALHGVLTDADVRRWLLDGEVVPRAWVDEEIAESEARFAAGGGGLWALREPPAEAVIGFVGFRPFFEPPEMQLLYGLVPAVWGRGLATEAAHTAMAYGFDTVGFDDVRAATDVPNTASIAVLERLGFEEWKQSDEGPAGTVFFRLGVERWRENLTTRR